MNRHVSRRDVARDLRHAALLQAGREREGLQDGGAVHHELYLPPRGLPVAARYVAGVVAGVGRLVQADDGEEAALVHPVADVQGQLLAVALPSDGGDGVARVGAV